jgi:hypothetical protein
MSDILETTELTVTLTPEESQEAEKAYQALLPMAMGLDEASVQPFRGSIDIARHNAINGYQEIKKLESRLKEMVKSELLSSVDRIPAIALAASFAALKINSLSTKFETNTLKLVEQARGFRRKLLKSADACAEYELLSMSTIESIKRGKGSRDVANDCIALASLFRENKAILAGKTPVSSDDIEQSAQIGSKLQSVLTPAGATSSQAPSEAELEAYDLRDRYWTLLVQHRDVAWRLGALLLGEQKVNELVLPLLSRERVKTPETPEVKQAKQEANAAKEVASKAEAEAKEKAKTAAKVSKDARKKK